MTSARKLKRQHAARLLHRIAVWRAIDLKHLEHARDVDFWPDDLDYEDGDWACTHCGGEGWREVDDLMWDDCDEWGYGPCTSCNGTGDRRKQWVF